MVAERTLLNLPLSIFPVDPFDKLGVNPDSIEGLT